jgi:hypothetical protein
VVEKIEQVVRLVRSKGVGVYFVTQNPLDVPETVLAQLSNRVQHALRAFTPRDQKAVKTAADTLRANPKLDTARAITELAVGEALVSFLDDKGTPAVVERAWILPPASRIGAITPEERQAVIAASVIRGHYEQAVDRDSAYEKLTQRTGDRQAGAPAPGRASPVPLPTPAAPRGPAPATASAGGALSDIFFGTTGPRGGHHEGLIESVAKSAARSVGSGVGRQIVRGVLGSIFSGR